MWDKPTGKLLFQKIPKKQEHHYDFQLLSSHASNMALENNYKTNRMCYILTADSWYRESPKNYLPNTPKDKKYRVVDEHPKTYESIHSASAAH